MMAEPHFPRVEKFPNDVGTVWLFFAAVALLFLLIGASVSLLSM